MSQSKTVSALDWVDIFLISKMTKSDIHVLFNHLHLQSVLTSQKASTTFLTTRLKRMASLVSVFALVAFLTFFCLFFQSGTSTTDSDDLQRVQRSLLGVPSPSVASRFSLWQKSNIVDNKNEVVLPASIKQSDIFISVKTTKQFHHKRLDLILKTWFQLARDETWFFTDDRDQEFDIKTSKLSFLFTIYFFIIWISRLQIFHVRCEGNNNKERSFKTVLFLDLPLQGWCSQQIAPSCHINLLLFVPHSQ